MRGHLQIIEMRKRGYKPKAVFIELGFKPIASGFDFDDPESALDHNLCATVFISDAAARHDMRFLVGCRVHIRAQALTDDVLSAADRIAKLASETILCDGHDLMIFKDNDWTVYANPDA